MAAPEMRDDPRFPGAKIHESAYVDDGVTIGAGSKVWHFVHVLGETAIGENCVLGQNVMVGPRVTMGNGCKVQNNVALYDGVVLEDDVFCGPSCVFTNVNNPRAFLNLQIRIPPDAGQEGRKHRRQRHHRLRPYARCLLLHRRGRGRGQGRARFCPDGRRPGPPHRLDEP